MQPRKRRKTLFGKRLKNLRGTVGLSQAELARKLGKSKRNVQNWEQGYSCPSANSLTALAKALNCSLVDLLDNLCEDHQVNSAGTQRPSRCDSTAQSGEKLKVNKNGSKTVPQKRKSSK